MLRCTIVIFALLALVDFASAQQQDWIKSWGFGGRSRSQVEEQLTFDSKQRVALLDRLCSLDDAQQQKLSRAADTDVCRFFREVDSIERKVETMDLGDNNRNINEVFQVISPIQTKLREGLFAEQSLFQKVVRSTLTDQQQSLYEAEMEKNRRRRWTVMTRSNLADIERSMPLVADQREKLLELMEEQELPIKMQKQMDGYAGYLKLLMIDDREAVLAEFLDDDQVEVISKYCERYRGWERMLKQ